MSDNFKKLYRQINDQINDATRNKPDLDPFFNTTNSSLFSTPAETVRSNTSSSFVWQVLESADTLSKVGDINTVNLYPNIFVDYGIRANRYLYDSDNGNLSLGGLDDSKLYYFSANLHRYSSDAVTATMDIPWPYKMAIYNNDNQIHASDRNILNNFNISLNSGVNKISILIYVSNNLDYFTINSKLGELVDKWTVPSWGSPLTPSGLIVTTDSDTTTPINNLTNFVDWERNYDYNSTSYNIFRSGPHSKFIDSAPYLSGVPTTTGSLKESSRYYYAISSFDKHGEAKPFFSESINTKPRDPKLFSFSTSGSSTVGTLTDINYYTYGMTTYESGFDGIKESALIGLVSGFIFPAYNSIQLSWSVDPRYLSGVFDGFYPSGFKLYRSTSGVFGSSSLIADVTAHPDTGWAYESGLYWGLQTGNATLGVSSSTGNLSGWNSNYITDNYTLIDSGLVEANGSPPSVGSITSGVGIFLNWDAPIGSPWMISGYKIYRSENRRFTNYSLATIITGYSTTGFLDNGYGLSAGYPKDFVNVASVSDPISEWRDTSVINGKDYYYKITSSNGSNNQSNFSDEYQITVGDLTAPSPPQNIGGWFNAIGCQLSWQNGSEIDLEGTEIWIARRHGSYNSFLGCNYLGVPSIVDSDFELYAYVLKSAQDAFPLNDLSNMLYQTSVHDSQCTQIVFKLRNKDYSGNVSDFG